jgi:hypothetical protein
MIGNGDLMPRRRALSRCLAIIGATAVTAAVAALAGGMAVTAAAASAPASGGWTWPRGLPAPGNSAGPAVFTALACAARSECTAVGISQGRFFAITERHGVWGKPVGIAAPVAGKRVSVGGPVLSCASAGNCAAGAYYSTGSQQGDFVVSETNGTWGKARKVRGYPSAISCPAPGDCTAVLSDDYLLNEKRGSWRTAFPVPGLAALNPGEAANPAVIACPSPGNCTAGGSYYESAAPYIWSYVATERHGIWGNARPLKNPSGAGLDISAVSCPSAGTCVAGGRLYLLSGVQRAFAVTETHGTWSMAQTLPGTSTPGGGIDQLDCPAAGACSAAGSFELDHGVTQPFVVSEKNGTWHTAQTITGAGPGRSVLDSLSCDASGNCVLAGEIVVNGEFQAASAAQVDGRWGPATMLRGIRALDHGKESTIDAVSCPPRSRCTAVGSFSFGSSGIAHLFVTAQR